MRLEVQVERVREQLLDALPVAPVERVADTGRRRGLEGLHDVEERRQPQLDGRPVGEPDTPTLLDDPPELARGRSVIRREHDAACRGHGVEGSVLEVEVLAVSDAVVDVEPALLRALLGGLDQGGRQVDAGHVGSSLRRELGDRTRAASEVEPLLAGFRLQPVDHELVDVRERVGDVLVRPGSPDDALLLLQLLEGHC
jgi:hypothetical protein